MVGLCGNYGHRKSVILFRRIRSHHPVKGRTALLTKEMDFTSSVDGSGIFGSHSKFSTARSFRPSEKLDGYENSRSTLRVNNEPSAPTTMPRNPLVIRNPVYARKLAEPIERKREYWSDNLLYIMRCEGLIPKDWPVVMDRPTPEEPYRLAANVVRLLEQEPQLYTAKSSIKLSKNSPANFEASSCRPKETRARTPFTFSQASEESFDTSESLTNSFDQSIYKCCECGRDNEPSSFSLVDNGRKAHSFPADFGSRSHWPSYGQSRNCSTSTASKQPSVPAVKRL